tara:strand:- start:126 stop:437 length:312 start_codon:yes stop_codon:yes gene_type:complete
MRKTAGIDFRFQSLTHPSRHTPTTSRRQHHLETTFRIPLAFETFQEARAQPPGLHIEIAFNNWAARHKGHSSRSLKGAKNKMARSQASADYHDVFTIESRDIP